MSNRVVLCFQSLCHLFALLNKSVQSISNLLAIYMLLQHFSWNFSICQNQTVLSSFQALYKPILLEDILLEDEETESLIPLEL